MSLKLVRPPGFTGKADKQLNKIYKDLARVLQKTEKSLTDDALELPRKSWDALAAILVEFAEDLHCDIGIWRSYEAYNREFFGVALPLTPQYDQENPSEEITPDRIHHFLWILYGEIDRELILSPTHEDLYLLAEAISTFLQARFVDVPRDSGIKTFLMQPSEPGWEIKRKLVWLGTSSYFFRTSCAQYIEEQGGEHDIATIDDFICQETTRWSGLGVIDILAALLDITDEQRQELRNWYERHMAFYQVTSINAQKGTMEAVNLINDKPYKIRVGEPVAQFKPKMFVSGSLVPWNGEWYWSGTQSAYKTLPKSTIKQLKRDFTTRMTNVAYRYCHDLAEQARTMMQTQYEEFLKYHGSDFVFYPDGKAMAADYQKQIQAYNEALAQEISKTSGQQHHAPDTAFDLSTPGQDLENGVAVYFNPAEGQEMMQDFNDVIRGLEKRGVDLTEDEAEAIRALIIEDSLSPNFVRRVVQEYSDDSIAALFFIPEDADDSYLEYLLRRYKGLYYRNRYPMLGILTEE